MGQGLECYSKWNPGEGLGLQGKQGTTVGEGERRRGGPPQESPCTHAQRLSEGGAPLVQATSGKKPLAQATGVWVLLVQATGGQVPLVWAKGSEGLSASQCLLHNLQTAGMDHGGPVRGQREVWPDTTGGL